MHIQMQINLAGPSITEEYILILSYWKEIITGFHVKGLDPSCSPLQPSTDQYRPVQVSPLQPSTAQYRLV